MSAIPAQRAPLLFDPSNHTYWLGERLVLHVTQVLEYFDEEMKAAKRRMPEAFEFASQIGTAAHTACALSDVGDLVEESVAELVRPRLEAWRRFRADTGFAPELIEARVYSREHDFAGTVDTVGTMRGVRWLLDRKTGVRSRFAELQSAAYAIAYAETPYGMSPVPPPVQRRGALYLLEDGTYRLEPHTSMYDRRTFLSMLATYRWLQGAP